MSKPPSDAGDKRTYDDTLLVRLSSSLWERRDGRR
ncbi:ORFL303W [Human betaherpesvirus 5]|nr:ORFL303W [Human betaherpesvirus 5]